MFTREVTSEQVKQARKHGECEEILDILGEPTGCKIFTYKDIAYMTDAEGRTHLMAWRTKIDAGSNLETGGQVMVRSTNNKKGVRGKNSSHLKAIESHTDAAVLYLPTGHVQVGGGDEADAMALLDDLIDAEGATVKEQLGELIESIANPVVAEAWSGGLQVPCPHAI
eukprot:2747096-Prymnesium_polylepis.1